MAISDRTRKLLWGRSGSRCAFCRRDLILEATEQDEEAVVGDECHIISAKPDGPRYNPSFSPDELDAYPNLILLCRVHHKLVDDQPNTYTTAILHVLKDNHERWVRETLESAPEIFSIQVDHSLENAFSKVRELMPELIAEMEKDIAGTPHTREFFLVSRKWVMNSRTPRFFYYFEDHDNLEGKAQILENHGFIMDVTVSNAKLYRMTEEFVELLQSH